MACNWSGSFLPPGNSTHGAAARPYGYDSVANMSLTVCCFVSRSCLVASFIDVFIELSCMNRQQKNSVTLPVSPSIKSPREINIINIHQIMHVKKKSKTETTGQIIWVKQLKLCLSKKKKNSNDIQHCGLVCHHGNVAWVTATKTKSCGDLWSAERISLHGSIQIYWDVQ